MLKVTDYGVIRFLDNTSEQSLEDEETFKGKNIHFNSSLDQVENT